MQTRQVYHGRGTVSPDRRLPVSGRPCLQGELLGVLVEPPAFYTKLKREMGVAWANFIFGPMESEGRDELLSIGDRNRRGETR